jgi:hypothetical protein
MKRATILVILLTAALAAGTAAVGDPGHGKGKGPNHPAQPNHPAKPTPPGHDAHHKISMTVVTSDHGTCSQNVWATDTLRRTYDVKQNKDGSYRVRRTDKGTFVTTGPVSPGACETGSKHGHVLTAGYTGKVHGFLEGTVTGGTFNPNGTCTAECGAVDFIAAFFTPGSQFTCNNGYAGCKFKYDYNAKNHQKPQTAQLLYHHWVDQGLNGTTEDFKGDIATG